MFIYSSAIGLPILSCLLLLILQQSLERKFLFYLSSTLMGLAVVASAILAQPVLGGGQTIHIELFEWIAAGNLDVSWGLHFNPLSVIMVLVVNVVSFCVHVYSVGYMARDENSTRFMAYLGLFTFMMLMLVCSDHLIQLFFGWEGVGLTSYLLIGFWHQKDSANSAAMKAFVVNRIGDLFFVMAMAILFTQLETLNISSIISQLDKLQGQTWVFLGMNVSVVESICLCLLLGAMGKSAQLGLHIWLPDAMEGPTPVSALIHAATMVTAGIFLLVRMSPLLEMAPYTKNIIVIVGASTAMFAATVALTQNDIKRVIAYSTCSQLGYMFFAIGVSAYSVAMFHLVTHAFFKALLFLGAGSVIHAMSDEQDMTKMGGIWRLIPMTYTLMWVGSLALAGVPFFAGFYSKEMILASTYIHGGWIGHFALYVGLIVAGLTALYSWRLLWLTFHGNPRADEQVMAHIHEPSWAMRGPLIILAFFAITSGWYLHHLGIFGSDSVAFWQGSLAMPLTKNQYNNVPHWIEFLAIFMSLCGIGMGVFLYSGGARFITSLMKAVPSLYELSFNKWFFDEIYESLFVQPFSRLSVYFSQRIDRDLIDDQGPNRLAAWAMRVANIGSQMHTGYVYSYAFSMLLGVVVFLAIPLLVFAGLSILSTLGEL